MITCSFEDGHTVNFRHVVTQAVVYKDNKILLTKRAEHMVQEGGKWALPGGYLDLNETIAEGIQREILEETGWEVENIERISVYDSPNRRKEDRQNVAFNYMCQATKEVGEPDDEVTAVEWVAFDDERLQNLAFDQTDVIKEFLEKQ